MWPGRGQQQQNGGRGQEQQHLLFYSSTPRIYSSILPPEVAARAANAKRFTPPQSHQPAQLRPPAPSFHNNNNNSYGNNNQRNGGATPLFQAQPPANPAFANQPGQHPSYYQSPQQHHQPHFVYPTPPGNFYPNHHSVPPMNPYPTQHQHPQPVQAQPLFTAPPNSGPFAPTPQRQLAPIQTPAPPTSVQTPPSAQTLREEQPLWRMGRKEDLELDAVSVGLFQHLNHNHAEYRERMEVTMSLFVQLETDWRPTGIGGWKALVRDSSGACSICVYTGAGPPPLGVGDWAKISCLWRSWGLQGLEVKAPPSDFLRRLPGLQGCAKAKLQRAFPDWVHMDIA